MEATNGGVVTTLSAIRPCGRGFVQVGFDFLT
jgi:hypothetical protein